MENTHPAPPSRKISIHKLPKEDFFCKFEPYTSLELVSDLLNRNYLSAIFENMVLNPPSKRKFQNKKIENKT